MRWVSVPGLVLGLALVVAAPSAWAKAPRALVYRGPGGCNACSQAVADLLRSAPEPFDVTFVGPNEDVRALDAAALADVTLYAQPGGDGTLDEAAAAMPGYGAALRDWVRAGGRYLGFCMGGFLAGPAPGFDLLPGDTRSYVGSPGSDVDTTGSVLVEVDWRGQRRGLYFQDGPYFRLGDGAQATVLATYAGNHQIAALVAPYGAGKVGVAGPHPEATADWYRYDGVSLDQGTGLDLAQDLLQELLK